MGERDLSVAPRTQQPRAVHPRRAAAGTRAHTAAAADGRWEARVLVPQMSTIRLRCLIRLQRRPRMATHCRPGDPNSSRTARACRRPSPVRQTAD
ncbi:hypothetical protein FAGKG844_770014 [Frankia sp. AgKG'84/4]